MAEKFADQEFVEYLVKTIVSHPEDVQVERKVDEMGVLLSLTINAEDMGYVIGKQGKTAKAIRTLLKIVGAKNNARVNLKIIEPEGSTHVRRPEPEREEVDTDVVDDLKI
ncbi:MAG TPA: KH domain-containing protein [Candidatus Bipolaricaulota bacterium]|nr:KH domain-containing protein [Candidatus Bipolaricaulota bacterium]